METFEHYGTYAIRNIGKSEQGIHMPSNLAGKYSIYINADASTIVMHKELPFKTDKFVRDMDRIVEDGKYTAWNEVEKELGLKRK